MSENKQPFHKNVVAVLVNQGPRSKILSGGAQALARFFFCGGGGGGGGEAETCYPGKIRVLVTLRYQKMDLKLTNSVLKRNVFTT